MANARAFSVALLVAALTWPGAADSSGEDYSFDLSELEKRSWELGGYAELRPALFGLDRNASWYRLRFYDRDEGDTTAEVSGRLQLEGSLGRGPGRLFARANGDYRNSYLGESFQTTLEEGYLSLKPYPSLAVEAGKRSLRWGTGYAWNPVGFVARPKDPDEPELNLEGFYLASAAYVRSLDGPLRTVSVTPVLLPVHDRLNDDFGESGYLNVGGKLYLLFYDTDVDLFFLAGGSRPNRYGFDFSTNIAPHFEVHGELAHLRNVRRRVVRQDGDIAEREAHAQVYLLGVRYLTQAETTWIVEYYHNGAGFTRGEMRDFFAFLDRGHEAFVSTGDFSLLQQAENLSKGGYARSNPMRDYLYMRASQKEPFELLYFTPAATLIANLNDRSFSVATEILYFGITNLEMRFKATLLYGESLSEFGEKQNNYRAEARVRYYF